MRVRDEDEDEAVRLANDSAYGLSGSVFTKDQHKAMRIGRQLKTGSVVYNDASAIYGVAEAPFGGRKDSGLGQVNGRHALRGYTHTLPILIDRWGLKKGKHLLLLRRQDRQDRRGHHQEPVRQPRGPPLHALTQGNDKNGPSMSQDYRRVTEMSGQAGAGWAAGSAD